MVSVAIDDMEMIEPFLLVGDPNGEVKSSREVVVPEGPELRTLLCLEF